MDAFYLKRKLAADVSPEEQAQLVKIMEECGEVIQACSKILYWGYRESDPRVTNPKTNLEQLRNEWRDLQAAGKRLGVPEEGPSVPGLLEG